MKFAITKSTLENMLSTLQPFLEKKDNSQITAHILFQVAPDELVLKATDMEMGLSITCKELIPESFGSFTCHGKKILDIIRILKEGQVTLENDGDNVLIKQNRSKYKLPSFDASTFPNFPVSENLPKVNIDSQKLITAFKKVSPAIAVNNPKFELNGALIDVRGAVINVVSTDTKRLALYKIEQTADKNLSIIIPKKAISEIQKIFAADLKLYYDETNLIMVSEDYFFFTKVISGKFPDYERIIPRELAHLFTLNTEKMIDAIRQVSILSQEIRITFESGLITFETLQQDNEEAKTGFETEATVENPFSVAVNSRFLLDFLGQCGTESFVLGFNEPNMPFQLKSEQFSTIVMPIIL
ncbi:MAG: DNA polymerase III subunit beta [Campylobacterales bacterium]